MKVTPKNYTKIVKEIKAKNELVYTVRGKVKRASQVDFMLYKNVEGEYELAAKTKK